MLWDLVCQYQHFIHCVFDLFIYLFIYLFNRDLKGTLMQTWKSVNIFVFVGK